MTYRIAQCACGNVGKMATTALREGPTLERVAEVASLSIRRNST